MKGRGWPNHQQQPTPRQPTPRQPQPTRPHNQQQPIPRQPQPKKRPHHQTHVAGDPFHTSGWSSQQYYRPEPVTPLPRNSISQPNQSYSIDDFVLPAADEFEPFPDYVDNGFSSQMEHDQEAVPETQMEPPLDDEVQEVQEQDVGVPKRKYKNRAPKQPWTADEEEALAQAWIQISTCKVVGNEQNASCFWKRVSEHFNKTMGNENRTHYSLTTKWRELNGALGLFNGLHHQATRLWQSGCNDLDVFNNACELFKKKHGKAFAHNRAWEVVKKHAKWLEQKNVQDEISNHDDKRRKSTESGKYESASNDDPILPNLNEDPSPPIDNRSRKGKKPVGETSSKSSVNDIVQEYTTKKAQMLDENALLHQQAYEKYIEEKEKKNQLIDTKQQNEDYKFFNKSHHRATGAMLEWVLNRKRAIAEKYGWNCDF